MTPLPAGASWLYHLTSLDNLRGILDRRGLWCKNELAVQSQDHRSVAFDHIQDRRARCFVPCGPGGPLPDYVPFYFCPRSPMLLVLHRGGVPGFTGSQRELVHLGLRLEALVSESLPFVFTDGHAAMAVTTFYTDLEHLGRLDWKVIAASSWANTPADPDRKRRKQAELLVHRFVPWQLVELIGVADQEIARRTADLLSGARPTPSIEVRSHWYY